MDHVQPSPEWQMFTVTVYLTTHFLPSMEGFAVFCTESILSYSSSGKAWYLKDTAKQTRNMHRATTKRTHTKYKVFDMLALRTSYKSNTCTVKNYIFFLLSHSKTPNYWALVKIYNAWAVMQDHIQLRPPELGQALPAFLGWAVQDPNQLTAPRGEEQLQKSAAHVKTSETWSAYTGPSILPVLWLRRI